MATVVKNPAKRFRGANNNSNIPLVAPASPLKTLKPSNKENKEEPRSLKASTTGLKISMIPNRVLIKKVCAWVAKVFKPPADPANSLVNSICASAKALLASKSSFCLDE